MIGQWQHRQPEFNVYDVDKHYFIPTLSTVKSLHPAGN